MKAGPIVGRAPEQLAALLCGRVGRRHAPALAKARVEEVPHLLAPIGLQTPDEQEPEAWLRQR